MTANTSNIERMAFFHPEGLLPAWRSAALFAAEGGRLATLPDIVDARLAGPDRSIAWSRYFTTASAEYHGKTPGGVDVLAVAHGIGPLSTLEGCVAAMAHERRGKRGEPDVEGGRIDLKDFHRLIDGAFGEVAIVELVPYLKRYRHPFPSLPASAAIDDPLAAARLGGRERLEAYVARLRAMDDAEQAEKGNAPRPDPRVLRMSEDSNRASYSFPVWAEDRRSYDHLPRDLEEGLATAHLLSTSQICNVGEFGESGFVIQVDAGPHGWSNGTRFVGWRAGAEAGAIHGGVDPYDPAIVEHSWTVEEDDAPAFEVLTEIDGRLFTQYPKEGASMDTGEARNLVTEAVALGDPIPFATEVKGYYGFFRYELADVVALAPAGANAYLPIGSPAVSGDGTVQSQPMQFYRIEADRSRRLLRKAELYADVERIVRIAGERAALRAA